MIIAIANHKGGTGKTTSTINIGRALSMLNKRTLLVDLDPQANLSYSLGLSEKMVTVSDYLTGLHAFDKIVCSAADMHVLPASPDLYSIGFDYSNEATAFLLRERLNTIRDKYDFILLDCPPTFSILTVNAFNAADGVLITLLFDILSIQGLEQVIEQITRVKNTSNPDLKIIGALGVIVNESRKLSEEVLSYIRENFNVNIFNNYIRNNVKAAEAPSFAESIIDYAPSSSSAKDYLNVTNELLKVLELNQLISMSIKND